MKAENYDAKVNRNVSNSGLEANVDADKIAKEVAEQVVAVTKTEV